MSAPAAGVSSAMRKVRLASALNPSCLRVLLAIMQLADERTPITTRLLASRLGFAQQASETDDLLCKRLTFCANLENRG